AGRPIQSARHRRRPGIVEVRAFSVNSPAPADRSRYINDLMPMVKPDTISYCAPLRWGVLGGETGVAARIRLRRTGADKQPSYRFVVADQHAPRDGRFIETLGYYNPLTNPATIKVNEERTLYWLKNGALPSETAGSLLRKAGVMRKF